MAPAGEILDIARRVGAIPGLTTEAKRARFLRAVAPVLGPAQIEHITLHCEHVARTAARLAGLMRALPWEVERARLVGLLHDLGKALIPDELLARSGPLNGEERARLSRHAAEGARLCECLGVPDDIARAVAMHHARFDEAPDAPRAAHIVSVADALVVMTTGRAYSVARTYSQALAELRRQRCGQFEPGVVVAAHILGASTMALAA
jgi:putative nucleotidyltransferase with HDIG domain